MISGYKVDVKGVKPKSIEERLILASHFLRKEGVCVLQPASTSTAVTLYFDIKSVRLNSEEINADVN